MTRSGAAPSFRVLHSGDTVSTYILADARNVHLVLVVTHVRYGMPHGKNKENKAYSHIIFLEFTTKWDSTDQRACVECQVCTYKEN